MKLPIDQTIKDLLNKTLSDLEKHFNADILTYYGGFSNGCENLVLRIIEELASQNQKNLVIILTSPGGLIETVERIVNIIRHHYNNIEFVVPDYAYSAGTVFCMSGDNIYMDYYSVLGPIDPQVLSKDNRWVPALGYLDKIKELVEKSEQNKLTEAEYILLRQIDLAELRSFEQARDLAIELLKNWLCKYKFKNWTTHRTDPLKLGSTVTEEEKTLRAEEIAAGLVNNGKWNSHARPINISFLNDLRLEVEDYTNQQDRRVLIRTYYELLVDYIQQNNYSFFLHTRKFL